MGERRTAPREANYELLRIVAMAMVVTLHYLSRADALVEIGLPLSSVRLVGNALESLCIVSVNVYVLISGYFLSASGARLRRVISLLCEILFYTIGIPLVLRAAGLTVTTLPGQGNSLWSAAAGLLPVSTEHYWFATAYVLMLLFTPVLNAGVAAMSRRQLRGTIFCLLFFFSFLKSVSPVQFVTDHAGYDFGWFLCLYLIAAYGRRYGFGWLERERSGRRGLILYLASAAGIYLLALAVYLAHALTGAGLTYYAGVPFHYNFVLTLTGGIGLFVWFRHLRIPEGRAARWIRAIAPCTFGIYLIHENLELRDRWFTWEMRLLGGVSQNPVLFVGQLLAGVALLYLLCAAADALRRLLFAAAGRMLARTGLETILRRIESDPEGGEQEKGSGR